MKASMRRRKATAKRTFRRYSDVAPPPHCWDDNHIKLVLAGLKLINYFLSTIMVWYFLNLKIEKMNQYITYQKPKLKIRYILYVCPEIGNGLFSVDEATSSLPAPCPTPFLSLPIPHRHIRPSPLTYHLTVFSLSSSLLYLW
jgi:hypothetical protein